MRLSWTVEVETSAGLADTAATVEGLRAALDRGRVVTRSRTTLTARCTLAAAEGPAVDAFGKAYRYPTARDRVRGWLRTTLLAPSRARRERDAIRTLLARAVVVGGPPVAPEPLALVEGRKAGVLHEALLFTRAVPGATDPSTAPPPARLAEALGACLGRIHAAGLVRVDAAPRNFLAVARPGGGFDVLKVDTGRAVRGDASSPHAAIDLATLIAGLEGTWPRGALESLVAAHAREASREPPGWRRRLAAARRALARRRPRAAAATPPPRRDREEDRSAPSSSGATPG